MSGKVQSPITPTSKTLEMIKQVEAESPKDAAKVESQGSASVAVPLKNIQLEWRAKPKSSSKKDKPKETNERRLAARQKQIDIGKATVGYKNFIAQVPK